MFKGNKLSIFIAIMTCLSFYVNYQINSERRLRKQVRLYRITLDSKINLVKNGRKHLEKYVYFRAKEYPRLKFKVAPYAFDILDINLMNEITYGDTLSIWVKNDLKADRINREVYGIKSDERVYLECNDVLNLYDRTSLNRAILPVFLLLISGLYLLFFYNRKKIRRIK